MADHVDTLESGVIALKRRRQLCADFAVDTDRAVYVPGIPKGASITAFLQLFADTLKAQLTAAGDDEAKLKFTLLLPIEITFKGIKYDVFLDVISGTGGPKDGYLITATIHQD